MHPLLKKLLDFARPASSAPETLEGEVAPSTAAGEQHPNIRASIAKNPEPSYIFRAPRVNLTPLHSLSFQTGGPVSESFRLTNISTSGLGLQIQDAREIPGPGATLDGELKFSEKAFRVKLKVIHVTGGILGASFVPDEPEGLELRKTIRRYFELEILALGMMKINPQHHKKEPDGDSHWIHGDYCDLYFVTRGDQVLRFRLTFLGNQFMGSAEGLKAGQVIDEDITGKILYKSGEVVTPVAADPELLDTARKFVRNIPHLSDAHREAISTLLGG